jgi:hypothetical protein
LHTLATGSDPNRWQKPPFDPRRPIIPCALDPGTELSPFGYQQLALCEQVAAPVSGLDLVLDRMGQGHLDLLARVGCSLAAQSRNVQRSRSTPKSSASWRVFERALV